MEQPFTPEELEAGRKLFAQECRFVAGAATPEMIPPAPLPEVVFLGRSNVGKSSLLNALTGRKTLARVSRTPGRTRQINFFDLGGRLMLVDVPGYGYAKAGDKDIRSWQRLWQGYVRERAAVRRALVLIDARHGLKTTDAPVLDLLDSAAVSWQAVLTKADEPKKDDLAVVMERVSAAIAKRPAAFPHLAVTSADKGMGIAELRAGLAGLALGN